MPRRFIFGLIVWAGVAAPALAQQPQAAPAAPAPAIVASAQEAQGPDAYADRFWAALSARKRVLDAAFIESWFTKAAASKLFAQLRVKKPEYTDRLVWALSKSLFDETLDATLKARTLMSDAGKAEVALETPEATPSTFRLWLAKESGDWRVDQLALEYGSSLRELLDAPRGPASSGAAPGETATAFVEKTIKAAQAAAKKDNSLLSDPAQIKLLCEPKLAEALLKEAANKDDQETRLDFDPILGGQDSSGVSDLTTRATGARDGRTLVEARWRDGKSDMRALYELAPGAKGWLIYDITQYSLDRLDSLFRNELK